MHVAVLGAGSLGSLLGGLLARRHDVTLVGREEHMKAVASGGLRITGDLERTPPVAATTDWGATDDVDLCLVTVKAYDTAEAAAELAEQPPPIALTLQNGFGPVGELERALPPSTTVLAGVTTYGALLTEPGVVRCTGRGDAVVGAPEGGPSAPATDVATAFRTADIACDAVEDMPHRRWEKLAINAGINPVTALAQVSNGAVVKDPLRPIAVTAAREVGTVAEENGIELRRDPGEALVEVARTTSENQSSMARDVANGRRTEIDAITGAVLDRIRSSPAPVNQVLYGLMVGYEQGAGWRG